MRPRRSWTPTAETGASQITQEEHAQDALIASWLAVTARNLQHQRRRRLLDVAAAGYFGRRGNPAG
jgi:hypothetical protein